MCLCHSFGVVTVVIVPPSDGVSFRVAVRVSVCCHCARTEALMSLLLPLLTLPRINRKTTLNQYKKKRFHARTQQHFCAKDSILQHIRALTHKASNATFVLPRLENCVLQFPQAKQTTAQASYPSVNFFLHL